ncbi:hypothetical protein KSD_69690 [Ktedonobacter sp. SOSP1-85]|nr:hypothetical protein [Ktedonobacter sp. SOSP1-85]GHO79198.1 hypothetical protein KSD_69690 [Ktedonobacter sp. SOSP1-85]
MEPLTAQEQRVLHLLAAGRSTQEMAADAGGVPQYRENASQKPVWQTTCEQPYPGTGSGTQSPVALTPNALPFLIPQIVPKDEATPASCSLYCLKTSRSIGREAKQCIVAFA